MEARFGLTMAGLALLAVVLMMGYAFGPDFQRYMKIKSM